MLMQLLLYQGPYTCFTTWAQKCAILILSLLLSSKDPFWSTTKYITRVSVRQVKARGKMRMCPGQNMKEEVLALCL